jgi:opacity protein-like surface antigen
MKKIVLVFAAVLITVSGFAQKTADIGIWGGSSLYYGDLDETGSNQTFNLNYGAYFRYNFNARIALRTMLLSGTFASEGMIEGVPAAFNKSVQDLSLQIEINYLKYILGVKNTPFSSYVLAGVGVAYFPYDMDPAFIASFNPDHNKGDASVEESEIAATIPFGIGFKFNLGDRWGIGFEYLMRKMFVDKLDDLDDPLAHIDINRNEVVYNDMIHNNDWSGYLGVHLTYKIYMGKKACPAYESKN